MKKIFVIKEKNVLENSEKVLSSLAYKEYNYAVEILKEKLVNERARLQKEKYDINTDMTEILKGVIEVYETKKGQFYETYEQQPVKTYNYNF